ncbi:MAG: SRPBCC family protein [Cyanobacteria bacterium SID2]|nr:SRPBCC family protein [Cyanobacteria bacterium SID2]MBP0006302.1 SRPBCC family protein [Cyanobacteria bacterium SBC]
MSRFIFTSLLTSSIVLSGLLAPQIPSIAADLSTPTSQLARRDGEVTLTRNEDSTYTAQLVIDASPEEVWSVIADYGNFSEFLPNIVSSAVVEIEGNRRVVEQISERRVLFLNVRSRIRTENIETQNQRIDFRLVEGDLDRLEGAWILEPLADSNHLLLTQTIEVEPSEGTPEGFFYDIFERSIVDTLEAIRDEVLRRRSG